MAKSVSVAGGESETMHCGLASLGAPTNEPLKSGNANTPKKSARTKRRVLHMDISFPSKWMGDGWISERPLLTSRAVFQISSRKATWLSGLLTKATYSCGTALESHQLRCREALRTLSHAGPGRSIAGQRQRASSPRPRQSGLGPALTLP